MNADHSKCKWLCNIYQCVRPNFPTPEEQETDSKWIKDMIHDPENSIMFKRKVDELKEEIKEIQSDIDRYCKLKMEAVIAKWGIYAEHYLDHSRIRLRKVTRDKEQFEFYYKVSKGKIEMKDLDIAEVKKVPIGKFITGPPGIGGSQRRQTFSCPFHKEKTPSMVWYTDSNTYHCFGGCGDGGDVIAFYMKMFKVEFKVAIKELTKFI